MTMHSFSKQYNTETVLIISPLTDRRT